MVYNNVTKRKADCNSGTFIERLINCCYLLD